MTKEQQFEDSPYGLNSTKRLTVPLAEEILNKPYQCLDHGFVRLIDYMGGDSSIVQAARVSYGSGTTKKRGDRALIRYLMRHDHNTPFEMVDLKFHAKMPIFVARQWVRHRTASINEISGRYSVIANEFYVPNEEDLGIQSTTNRQGRDSGGFESATAQQILGLLREDSERSFEHYDRLLNQGLTRELARIGLGLNTYTEWYWKVNLHNLNHFLVLRKDAHAQKEIRVYADAMGDIASKVAPLTYEAFEDYRLKGTKFSRLEMTALGELLTSHKSHSYTLFEINHFIEEAKKTKSNGIQYKGLDWDKSELEEFYSKLKIIFEANEK